jgi:Arc/MetJ-type ribon-helix-helix transcriptional regulator
MYQSNGRKRMMLRMKERVTISVEPDVLAEVRADVEAGRAPNLSAAIEKTLRAGSKRQALREALELSEAEHGPIGKEAEEWARREMERTDREISSLTQER